MGGFGSIYRSDNKSTIEEGKDMNNKIIKVRQGTEPLVTWIKSAKFEDKVLIDNESLSQSNGWHITYLDTKTLVYELNNYPFTVTVNYEEAQELKSIRTDEQLFELFPDLHIVGDVAEVLGINLYKTYFMLTANNDALVWSSTGNIDGSVLMYGGHLVE